MTQSCKEIEARYSSMSTEDFDNIDKTHLTDEAKVIYEKELSKRQTSDWKKAESQRIETSEKKFIAHSELDRNKRLLTNSRKIFFFTGLLIINFFLLTVFLFVGYKQVTILFISVDIRYILFFLLLAIFGLIYRTNWGRILGIIASFLFLFNVPFGTIIGLMGFYCFRRTKLLFGPNKRTHSKLVNDYRKSKNHVTSFFST